MVGLRSVLDRADGRKVSVFAGVDALAATGDAMAPGGRVAVVVADQAVVANGYVERVHAAAVGWGIDDVRVAVVPPGEPTSEAVDVIAGVVRAAGAACDDPSHLVVVGVGGGSALDSAKQAAAIAPEPAGIEHYALAAHPLPARSIGVVAIPTTAGTGSEVTRTCIVTSARARKVWTWGEAMVPDVVVLDPQATVTLPAHVTAATGLDAFVHAAEAMTGRRVDDVIAEHAGEAVRLVLHHLGPAVTDGSDLAVRLGMQQAAMLAGLAIDAGGTGVAHAIGHALGNLGHVPHGVAVAVGFGAALDWNVAAAPDAFAGLADAARCRPDQLIDAYTELLEVSDFADAVRRVGPLTIDAEALADSMIAPENVPMVENNCRRPDDADRLRLARATLRLWDQLRSGATP